MKTLLQSISLVLITLFSIACSKKEDAEPELFEHYQSNVFNENLANDIVVDSKNNKWITTYAGLLKYDNQNWTIYDKTSSNSPSDTLFDLAIDSKDNIYCLTMSQKIVRFDGSNWSTISNINLYGPTSLCVDHNDNLWVAAFSGLYRFDGTQWTSYRTTLTFTLSNHWANGMIADNTNTIWIACESGGLVKFDGTNWTVFTVNQDVPNAIYNCVSIDGSGIIWVGAMGFGAFINQDNSFAALKRDSTPSLCNTIYSICFDKNQNIWFGTENGLLKYNGTDWTSFFEDDYSIGFPIRATVIDHNDDIWAVTWNGVYKIYN